MNLQESSQTSFFCPLPGSCAFHGKTYSLEAAQQVCAGPDSQHDRKRASMELEALKDDTVRDITIYPFQHFNMQNGKLSHFSTDRLNAGMQLVRIENVKAIKLQRDIGNR